MPHIQSFAASARSSIGVEWELQLVDRDSNELRQCATAVLEVATKNGVNPAGIHKEMLLNTLEFTSQPRTTVRHAVDDLNRLISEIEPYTDMLRINLAAAGSHPFANPAYQRVTDSKRYANLVERTQYWGRQMLLYGTHVHVGVESEAKVWPLISAVLARAGQLQALSASSPYWAGEDTGYATNRAMVFQQLPTAGTPHQFDRWADYQAYTNDVLNTHIIEQVNEIRWDIRPSPKLGTIEVRICDAASNTVELSAHAALIHCLVEHYSCRLDAGQDLPRLPDWFVRENKWRSARYGMDAVLIVDSHGTEEPVVETLTQLLETLEPTAHKLGCATELATIADLIKFGVGYQRQRQVAKRWGGSLDAVVEYLCAEFQAGIPLPATDQRTFTTETSSRKDHRSGR